MIKLKSPCGTHIYFNVFNIISVEESGQLVKVKHKQGVTMIGEPVDQIVSKIEKALIAMAGGRNV